MPEIPVLGRQLKGWAGEYLADPAHASWKYHYSRGSNGGWLLAFTEAWKAKHLPPGIGEPGYTHGHQCLRCVLLDTQTGQLHHTQMAPGYDIESARLEGGDILDEDWNPVDPFAYRSLQSYFYVCHHCPCHRKHDLRQQCGLDLDDECEGNRFRIERVTPLFRPDLILLSEVHGQDALEEFLTKGAACP